MGDPIPAPVCPACGGTRLVAPDAFSEWEPWEAYRLRMAVAMAAYPASSSAIGAGLIRAITCPVCAGGKGAAS